MKLIKQKVTHCDFFNKEYSRPVDGGGYLSQGATGRWCVVMWAGPEYLKEGNMVPIDPDEAWEQMLNEGATGTRDF